MNTSAPQKKNSRRLMIRVVLVTGATIAAYQWGSNQSDSQVSAAATAQDRSRQPVSRTRTLTSYESTVLKNQSDAVEQRMRTEDNLRSLIRHDSQQGLDALSKLPPGKDTQMMYRDLFGSLAGDPDFAPTAAILASKLPPGPNREIALDEVALTWGNADAKAMLDWASELPAADSGIFKDALLRIVNYLDKPALAAQYLGKITDVSVRDQALSAIANSILPSDPAGALGWLDQVTSPTAYNNSLKTLFSTLSQHNPSGAAALIGNLTDSTARQTAITSVAATWGQNDPPAALAWAQTLPGPDGANATNSILTTWAKKDPAAVLAMVQNSPDPSAYLSVLPAITQSLGAADPQAALALAQSLPDGATKDSALSGALLGMAQNDFTGAWNYATNLPEGSSRDTVVESLVGSVVKKNPAKAAALIDQIPAGSAQISAASAVAASWVQQNPPPFLNWLNGLPTGDVRDAAIVQLDSSGQAAKHPATVFADANSISNAQLRAAQVQLVLTNWAAKDPQAALDAAQNADLPDEQRTSLVRLVNQATASGK